MRGLAIVAGILLLMPGLCGMAFFFVSPNPLAMLGLLLGLVGVGLLISAKRH